jgi:hypothetical protein
MIRWLAPLTLTKPLGVIALWQQVERLRDARAERGSFMEHPAACPTVELVAPRRQEAAGAVISPYKVIEEISTRILA